MSGEQLGGEEDEAMRYLRLLGLEHLADKTIPGRSQTGRDFLEICGTHSRPLLAALETLDPDDPQFEPTREALRSAVMLFMTPPGS